MSHQKIECIVDGQCTMMSEMSLRSRAACSPAQSEGLKRLSAPWLLQKGGCVVGLLWPDKIRASEEVCSDCYKGLRSGAGEAVYSSRYQRIRGLWWGAARLIGIKESM